MSEQGNLIEAVGAADMFELLGRAFSYPDVDIAEALSSGSFQSDLKSCLLDAGVDEGALDGSSSWDSLCALQGRRADDLLEQMRISYSLTYLSPGKPPIYPYESAFRHRAEGKPGLPALFRSPITLDVEREMRAAGVIPADSRKIPCDAFWNECAYLSYALGKRADGMQRADLDAMNKWESAVSLFVNDHASQWMANFLEISSTFESAGVYGDIAALAKPFIQDICKRYGKG